MTRRATVWVRIVVGAIAVICGIGVVRLFPRRDNAAFQEQLKLAWAEGLPTNAAQMASTIKPAGQFENAAPAYTMMGRPYDRLGRAPLQPEKTEWMLLNQPSWASWQRARDVLLQVQSSLAVVDGATKLPRCWFDRNWSEGAALSEPEFGNMKLAAKLVGLRGTLALAQGHPDAAIASAREIFALSKHAGEEGTGISARARSAIYLTGMGELAYWAFANPRHPEFAEELRGAIANMPRPDVVAESRDLLFMELSAIELVETPAGRLKLGLKPGDAPIFEQAIATAFISQPRAKIRLVKAERAYRRALQLQGTDRSKALSESNDLLNTVGPAFPTIFREIQDGASVSRYPDERSSDFEAYKLSYTAAWRALAAGGRAKSIKTDDLLSPFDGTPIHYEFTGSRMRIWASSSNGNRMAQLVIPPDKPVY